MDLQQAARSIERNIETRLGQWRKTTPTRAEVIGAIKTWNNTAEQFEMVDVQESLDQISETIYAATKMDWASQTWAALDKLHRQMADSHAVGGRPLSPEERRNRRGLRF